MNRRASLPGAAELFRSTGDTPSGEDPSAGEDQPARAERRPAGDPAPQRLAVAGPGFADDSVQAPPALRAPSPRRRPRAASDHRPTGRERHEEKITVYVSNEELLDLEHVRLGLRGDHGLAVDRGRIVREALAVVLADFDAKGDASILVRRLRGH